MLGERSLGIVSALASGAPLLLQLLEHYRIALGAEAVAEGVIEKQALSRVDTVSVPNVLGSDTCRSGPQVLEETLIGVPGIRGAVSRDGLAYEFSVADDRGSALVNRMLPLVRG